MKHATWDKLPIFQASTRDQFGSDPAGPGQVKYSYCR